MAKSAGTLVSLICLAVSIAAGSEYRGEVTFNGLPVPGATVKASCDGKSVVAITDQEGLYVFLDLADGTWTVEVSMFGFAPATRDVVVAPNASPAQWTLTMLPSERLKAEIQKPEALAQLATRPVVEESKKVESPVEVQDDLRERAADGFLMNGTVNNGAASPFGQAAAFGNNRFGGRSLYTGGIGFVIGNSTFDARPYSLTGQNTPKADYSRMTGGFTFGGPLRIPGLFENGPNFFVGYQRTRNSDATVASVLVPDMAQRNAPDISPQAQALLSLYPLPNFSGGGGYNYQVPLLAATHQDAVQTRLAKSVGSKDQVYGRFALQSTRSDNTNLFGFLDTSRVLGVDSGVNWVHRFNQRWFLNLGYQFSRLSTRVSPYFANRVNVSGEAGIAGNNQDPMNWGPPALIFSSGLASLSDAQSSFNRSQTGGVSGSAMWNRGAHNFTFGGDLRRQQFNYLSQQDPRGTFTFTGQETGSDFGDFLLGVPSASSIAFGNADKYLRQTVYDAYFTDDWRINQALTVNAGVRWDYGAPMTELYGRLVNLDIAPGFTAAAPVLGSNAQLVRPYKRGLSPRIGLAWRPAAASSLVVRAGYGIYYDTSVYQAIATRLAQQPPLSKTLSVQNNPSTPLTLADGFDGSSSMNTFAVDPRFRPGYAQNWQLSLQRDLPASLQLTATYLGAKGTHALQAFLPNTYPQGTTNSCSACPVGFVYLTSYGNASREAGQIQLRRRLRSGLAASLQYTYSKSIDDAAALGGQRSTEGLAIAQNWLDLRSERALSTFDQRHLLSFQMQYTTGMGISGGTLLGGWQSSLLKDWTFSSQVTAGSGMPETPIYLAPVQGTGVTGTLRPDYTGAPLYEAPAARFVNPAAYAVPVSGKWGNAGRNSITGPPQFLLNASIGRTFRLGDRLNLDLRVDSINAPNHVNFTAWNTTVNSAQFGLPAAANAMRSVQTTLRLRF